MHPVLAEFFGIQIHTFGALIALAFILGVGWALLRSRTEPVTPYAPVRLEPDTLLEAGFWIIIAAILGARLTYVLFFPQLFFADPIGVLFGQGGLVWYGGVIGAVIGLKLFSRIKQVKFWQVADLYAPPAALGLAIGRIGCLMAGCCFGSECSLPWAVHYPEGHPTHGMGVHPTQIYESILMLVVAVALDFYHQRKNRAPGQTTGILLVLFGLVRFSMEYYRGDRLVWLEALNLSASQILSLGAVIAGIVIYVVVNRQKAKHAPIFEAPVKPVQPQTSSTPTPVSTTSSSAWFDRTSTGIAHTPNSHQFPLKR